MAACFALEIIRADDTMDVLMNILDVLLAALPTSESRRRRTTDPRCPPGDSYIYCGVIRTIMA